MKFDVSIKYLGPGKNEYNLHSCSRPINGIQKILIGVYEEEYKWAVVWLNTQFDWKTKLFPTQYLACKFQGMLKDDYPTFNLRIVPDNS